MLPMESSQLQLGSMYLELELPLDLGILSMALLTVLDGENIVFVSLGLPDFVFDRLDASLVVVLVHLPVDCNCFLQFFDGNNGFLCDCRLEGFAYFGIVLVVAMASSGFRVSRDSWCARDRGGKWDGCRVL